MRVLIIAGGHAPPFEPAEAPFHGVARRVPFRVAGLGFVPLPGQNNRLDALLLSPGAEGVAVIGPVGDQAESRRVRLGFHQGPGLGAVVALAARHAQGTAAADPPRHGSGVLKPPRLRPRAGAVPLFLGAPVALTCARRLCCPAVRRTDSDRPAGRPDDPVAPVGLAAIDRAPLAVRGPRGAHPCHPAQCFHKKTTMSFIAHAYIGTSNQKRMDATPLGIGHRGCPRGNTQREE